MRAPVAVIVAAACIAAGCGGSSSAASLPPVGHVFTIVLENKNYRTTFAKDSPAPYLVDKLADKGQLLTRYYGTGHSSLGNYITMISGQSENPATQGGCPRFTEFRLKRIAAFDQAVGTGCVYPAKTVTVADQLAVTARTWRGYFESMGEDAARDGGRSCAHPRIGARDRTQEAARNDQYATRHNPFVYFHSIIDDRASCAERVVNLARLRRDLRLATDTPDFSYIVPDLCSNGHDDPCVDRSQPGGYAGIDAFLKVWVPRILRSPAFKEDGLLIITFDESESGAAACCFVPEGPNVDLQGIQGPGGGRTGAVLISPFIEPGTVNDEPYNHYDYLHTVEDIFGLEYLGYADHDGVRSFGTDVFNG